MINKKLKLIITLAKFICFIDCIRIFEMANIFIKTLFGKYLDMLLPIYLH